MNYIKIARMAWSNQYVLNPNVHVNRIDQIDYIKLKEMGVKYLVFDKDNTLTSHLENHFYDDKIKNCIEQEVKSNYDSQTQVFIVSNSIKTQEQQLQVEESLGLKLILSKKKKPDNFTEIITYIRQNNPKSSVKNHEIAFFGDRLFTDIYLANTNGAISVYTNPFNNKNENLGITLMRKIEFIIFSKFGSSRSTNLFYLNKKITNFDKLVTKQTNKVEN